MTPGSRTRSAVSAAPHVPAGAAPDGGRDPAQWHRVLTVLADVSLFIGTRGVWTQAASHRPALAAVVSLCYASVLACGVLALTVRRIHSLARVDAVVLLTALTLVACAWSLDHAGGDEAALTAQAARELTAGHAVYGHPWPWLFHGGRIALTPTAAGGYDFTYGYPPLAPLLTAPLLRLGPGGAPATAAATLALLAGTVTLWRMLPVPWRPAATMLCLGFGFLPSYARQGYPAVVALALLVPVVVRWPGLGGGGRLGAAGIARAVCLGAACAAQQLPWFVAPFLLAGVYAVRRGELGARAAARVVLRIVGVAAATWLLFDAYFLVRGPGAWLAGIALPLTQGAVLHGQGLVGVSLYLTHGSDRLDWYGRAGALLAAALLTLFVLFVRRLGPAATVLPWCAFYLATRSQDGYYLLMTPLWLAAAVTAPLTDFARAWQPRPWLPAGPARRWAPACAGAALLLPALVSAGLAVSGRPPLRMGITAARRATAHAPAALTVRVTNTAGTALTPHYMLTAGQGMSRYWTLERGPATLPAHTTATVTLRAPAGASAVPARAGAHLRLRAFTAGPQTLSTRDVPPASLSAPPRPPAGSRRREAQVTGMARETSQPSLRPGLNALP